ncbi:MAG: hypothetical protein IPL52_06465 [Flavobacteriales bacterium]|nr:hypothetical protein [Flavobacteriales bacterium]
MSAQRLEIMKAAGLSRRSAINELHFMYNQLMRMLPIVVRRSPEAVARVLQEQLFQAGMVLQRLTLVASDHGQAPQLRLCEEAAALLDRLFHAERARAQRIAPGMRTVRALKAVHAHLTREWGNLVDGLPRDLLPDFHAEAMDMQRHEMRQYQDLVDLETALHAVGAEPVRAAMLNQADHAVANSAMASEWSGTMPM